ncbi:cation diffusion facilitator family transporter [Cryptosporangium sp. NPDC048952]|uniref:cation diffusion facilitator family transporter n=1 Tax=Cryptosporangium sp. NPDC048952 TaxID=3363961 RepID=UPI00371F44FF
MSELRAEGLPEPRDEQGGESTLTVVVAGAANLAISIAKAVGGILAGSSAMLSEAAHSLADTITEVLLLTAVKRSGRPADESHQFGYGQAHYFWAFIAALATFTAGSVFSIFQGVHTILEGEEPGDFLVSYIVLAVAFVIESISLGQAVRQIRGGARRWKIRPSRYLRRTPDTALKAVAFEDSAALVGLVLAAAGLAGTEFTGSAYWDGGASILIGVLLAVVAVTLGRDNASYLVGRSATPRVQQAIEQALTETPGVEKVVTLFTQHLGPHELLVAAKVDFADGDADQVEHTAEEAERRLREQIPSIREVFLDPTPHRAAH